MGKLLQSIITKLQELDQRRQEPAPDYSDPHAALDYIKRRNAEAYERKELGRKLIRALRSLPKAQQDEFYSRAVLPAARQDFTKAAYDNYLDPRSVEGKTGFDWILKDENFGQSWHQAVETLEEMIGPEEEERLADEVDTMVAPTNPLYPDEDKLVYPFEKEIEEIKNSLNPLIADYSLDIDILNEVKEDLAYVSDDVRELINANDQAPDGVRGYQSMVNGANYDAQNRFLRQDLENGRFSDKFRTIPSSDASDHFFYDMDDLDTGENGQLKQQDIDDIRKLKPQIPDGIKNDVISVVNKMDSLGEDSYRNEQTNTIPFGATEQDKLFYSEQGVKLYAYWPLYNARQKLVDAVREKDMLKIRQAHAQYREVKKTLDEMLGIVRKHPTGLSEGNVNVTRPLAVNADVPNPVPLDHMQDYVGQSQVNGLFCFYALTKNTRSTAQQLLEDPVGVMKRAGEEYAEKYGLGSRKTAGEKLYWGLSGTISGILFDREWGNKTGQLCSRGFNAVACLSDDPKERARIAGTAMLAVASGTLPVKEHSRKWQKLVDSSKAQQKILYQHAVLLPEDEFKPMEYAEAFSKPDWAQKLDTNALIDRLKQEGRLDYGQLADRVNQIIAQAKTCDTEIDTKYSSSALIEASHSMFKEILKKASPEERDTEGYKKLEAYTNRMLLDTASFQQGQRQLHGFMDVQKEAKTGIFLSSENSDEQKKMVRSQNTFRYKVLQLQGKELPASLTEEDKNYLKSISLSDAYRTARDATFDYCVKKTDNGRSRFFVHNTGSRRLEAAEDSIAVMDKMAKKLELRTPAQELIDSARKDVFDKRRENDWTPDDAERAAAKLMYGMMLQHQGFSAEEQKARLEPNRLEMGIAYIRGQDAFKKMMRNEGAAKVADYVAEGHGKLTDAYVRGMNGVAKERNQEPGKDPNQMTHEEKSEIWKNQPLQM